MVEKERVHRLVLGKHKPPTPLQKRIYGNTRFKGVSYEGKNREILEATLILAMAQSYAPDSESYEKVYLFVKVADHAWVHDEISRIALDFTKRIRSYLTVENLADGQVLLRQMRKWLETIHIGYTVLWEGSSAPEHWACYGYHIGDPIPEWMRKKLWDPDNLVFQTT
jgi:hypothetical protein